MSRRRIPWKGRFGPFELGISEHTFEPSTISTLMADALDVEGGETVIDVGCGSGILSIIAAKLGAARVFGIDSAPDVVEVARENARDQGVGDVTAFFQGDLFDPLPEEVEADVVIGDVSGAPDTLAKASGWFPNGVGGGPRGAELPVRMLERAREYLKPGGRIFLPTGTLQDEETILDRARQLYSKVSKKIERKIPLPSSLAEHPAVARLIREGVVKLDARGSRFLWTARVWVGSVV